MEEFRPRRMAKKLAEQLDLTAWRTELSGDELTKKWLHVFAKLAPDQAVSEVAAALIAATQGNISPAYLYSLSLAAWSYGVARAFDVISKEEVTLWEGTPLEFPWTDATEYPPEES